MLLLNNTGLGLRKFAVRLPQPRSADSKQKAVSAWC